MIAPHKKNRKRPATSRLRRYKRRFKVERFFSWCEDFRRLVVRWEYHAENYLGFVLLACLRMLNEIRCTFRRTSKSQRKKCTTQIID